MPSRALYVRLPGWLLGEDGHPWGLCHDSGGAVRLLRCVYRLVFTRVFLEMSARFQAFPISERLLRVWHSRWLYLLQNAFTITSHPPFLPFFPPIPASPPPALRSLLAALSGLSELSNTLKVVVQNHSNPICSPLLLPNLRALDVNYGQCDSKAVRGNAS